MLPRGDRAGRSAMGAKRKAQGARVKTMRDKRTFDLTIIQKFSI